ncbi:MAG: hypothetical protein R3E08_02400 [Thiotrichaceae bacterium]
MTIATRGAHAALVNLMCPEIMCYGIETPEELIPLLYNASVVAVGRFGTIGVGACHAGCGEKSPKSQLL